MASMFSRLAGAKMTGNGNNIRDGLYKLVVENVQYKPDGHSGDCFIAELRVLESAANGECTLTDDGKGVTATPVIPNAPGTVVSVVCNITKFGDTALGAAKSFVFGCLAGLGYSEEQITEDVMLKVCDQSKNPLRGMVVENATVRTINKGRINASNAGKILTLNKWKPVAQTGEQVKAQRAALDNSKAAPAVAQAPAAPTPAPAPAPAASATPGLDGLL